MSTAAASRRRSTVNYKGLMYSGVPNLAYTFGYTNASWTLKADLTAQYVCRLLNHMRKTGARMCLPPAAGADMPLLPWVDFSSGYFQRAAASPAQAGRDQAVEAEPELPERPGGDALRRRRRRRARIQGR